MADCHSRPDGIDRGANAAFVQQGVDLRGAIAPVAAECADCRELAAGHPARHGLGVDTEKVRDLRRRQ